MLHDFITILLLVFEQDYNDTTSSLMWATAQSYK